MTQRVFDVNNEQDVKDLWSILPDEITRIRDTSEEFACKEANSYDAEKHKDYYITTMLKINWHDKAEITRPIQEATEADIGKLCKFWNDKGEIRYGRLCRIINQDEMTVYSLENMIDYRYCRRLTKQEIEELC